MREKQKEFSLVTEFSFEIYIQFYFVTMNSQIEKEIWIVYIHVILSQKECVFKILIIGQTYPKYLDSEFRAGYWAQAQPGPNQQPVDWLGLGLGCTQATFDQACASMIGPILSYNPQQLFVGF